MLLRLFAFFTGCRGGQLSFLWSVCTCTCHGVEQGEKKPQFCLGLLPCAGRMSLAGEVKLFTSPMPVALFVGLQFCRPLTLTLSSEGHLVGSSS